jgi:hypothetical protein
MPEATTVESTIPTDRPARDLGVKWFEVKLAERLLQAGTMAKNVAMMRRGSFKMQDGTLGKATGEPEEPDDMNIRVGDETTHNHYAAPVAVEAPPQPENVTPEESKPELTLGKIALTAALAGLGVGGWGGLGAAWMLGAFDKPEPPAVTIPVDNNDTRGFQFR